MPLPPLIAQDEQIVIAIERSRCYQQRERHVSSMQTLVSLIIPAIQYLGTRKVRFLFTSYFGILMKHESHKNLRSSIRDFFPLPVNTEPHLRNSLDHVLQNAGSLIRPQIVASMFKAFDLPASHAAELGVALEYFHTASLLFDDLPCMDDASERRGQPSIHVEFGESGAILTALALINRAYALIWKSVSGSASAQQNRALEYIERYLGIGGLLNGQSMDLNYASLRNGHQVTEAIAMGKTVSLIRLTLVLPGILGGATPDELQLLDRVAVSWGLTYQIVDDLKDILHTPGESGKTGSRDVSMGRPNIALAIGVPGAVQRLTRLIAIGDRMLQRLVTRRPGVVFLQELRLQLDAEAQDLIDNACQRSRSVSLQGVA
jgi:geranylgeranyl pyrophosphate synthase